MSEQGRLWGGYVGAPYVRGSETSREAAVAILETSTSMRARVYRYVVRQGDEGATDDEIEAASGQRHQTISARRRELVQSGHLKDSGRKRLTRSGRRAVVWTMSKESE